MPNNKGRALKLKLNVTGINTVNRYYYHAVAIVFTILNITISLHVYNWGLGQTSNRGVLQLSQKPELHPEGTVFEI